MDATIRLKEWRFGEWLGTSSAEATAIEPILPVETSLFAADIWNAVHKLNHPIPRLINKSMSPHNKFTPLQFFIMSHTRESSSKSQTTAEGFNSKLRLSINKPSFQRQGGPIEPKIPHVGSRFDGTGAGGSLSYQILQTLSLLSKKFDAEPRIDFLLSFLLGLQRSP